MLTTRIKEVAEIGHVHQLQCLNEDDGWELLRKKVIPKLGDKDDAEYLEDEVIWAYALCIKWIVGGVVSTDDQREGETMLDVAERYLGDLAQRSMVQVELDDGTTWLRHCKFKSCGLHDLMRDLCLAKAKQEEFSSVIAIKSSGNELVSSSSTSVPGDFNPRRLAIYFYDYKGCEKSVALDLELILGSIAWERIRSLVLTPKSNHIEYPLIIGNFSKLRYLELEKIKFPNGKLPRRITRLVHLRHLKIRFCILKELPASIGNLRYLQILNLRFSNPRQLIIPNVFWKLRQLMNLNLPFNTCVKKDQKLRLDGLSKLELLQGIDICQFNVKDVAELANLRFIELLINGSSTFEDVAWFINYVNIDTSHRINGVSLSFKDCDFRPEEGQSILERVFQCSVRLTWWVYNSKLPKLNFDGYQPNNLIQIRLDKSEFEEDPFQILEKLPNLRHLALRFINFPGKEMVCSATGFSQLRMLSLKYLSNLEVWTMEKGAMPNLSELEIRECRNLKMLPDQLRYLTALKTLKILQMPWEFRNRVGVVNGIQGEDFDKIRHVRTLIIG